MYTGEEFEKRRIELNLSQKQIADLLQVDQSTVSRIENGLNDRLSLHIAYNGLLNELEEGANNGKEES
jgi:transcriptional regulator with XRE-family HTH domain